MQLQQYIQTSFPRGLSYVEGVLLCQRLFCTVDGLPQALAPECTKEGLAHAFAALSREGFFIGPPGSETPIGASRPEHWLGVIRLVLTTPGGADSRAADPLVHKMALFHANDPEQSRT